MSDTIKAYREKVRDVEQAKEWAGLIGSPYKGGGGGIGRIVSLDVTSQVYHQYSNGANNYHTIPKGLAASLASVIKADADSLLKRAVAHLEIQQTSLAQKARDEHAALMQEAGIAPA